ncbi:MAG: 30S ribosomal protein S16 [Alphaproteobacteria bacterium]|nr:MAG: 30S ribosomal protein S16 [Alphaproteobacteria bacterium]
MALKIRLTRGGAKKKPFYRIVVAENTSPRDGKFVERIGTYNPMVGKDHKERYVIKEDRAKHWMSVGAKPTERVAKIFGQLKISDAPEIPERPKKSQPKGKK